MEYMELTDRDLDAQLLPDRCELFNFGVLGIGVVATNTSVALNAGTILSLAGSVAIQSVRVG